LRHARLRRLAAGLRVGCSPCHLRRSPAVASEGGAPGLEVVRGTATLRPHAGCGSPEALVSALLHTAAPPPIPTHPPSPHRPDPLEPRPRRRARGGSFRARPRVREGEADRISGETRKEPDDPSEP